MDQKWFVLSIFGILCFLNFSDVSFVYSYTLSNPGSTHNEIDPSAWESKKDRVDFDQGLPKDIWENFRKRNGDLNAEIRPGEGAGEKRKWLKLLTFDKLNNLTEKEKGPQNETKITVINTEDHLKIFENEDEDEDEDEEYTRLQEGEKTFSHFLSPESFLTQIISEDRSKSLERAKRQAENGKRKCRCRRKRRRGMARRRRRRRRRNRVGQQQRPARRRRRRRGRRRNGRRRGRRRCVCRKKEDDDGKSEDGENPDVEGADGEEEEEETTEGGDESTTEEGGGEEEGGDEEDDDEESDGEKEEKEKEEESEEGEESDEESDEEEAGEEEDAGENLSPSKGKMPSGVPTYVFPYPNMVETPIMVMPGGGVPVGSFPTSAVPTFRVPSYPSLGALLPGNSNPKIEN